MKNNAHYVKNIDDYIINIYYERDKITITLDTYNEYTKILKFDTIEGLLSINGKHDINDKEQYKNIYKIIKKITSEDFPDSKSLNIIIKQFDFLMKKYPNTYYFMENTILEMNTLRFSNRYLFLGPEISTMRFENKSLHYNNIIGFDDTLRMILYGNDIYRIYNTDDKINKRYFLKSRNQKIELINSENIEKIKEIDDVFKYAMQIKLEREKN